MSLFPKSFSESWTSTIPSASQHGRSSDQDGEEKVENSHVVESLKREGRLKKKELRKKRRKERKKEKVEVKKRKRRTFGPPGRVDGP